MRETEYFIIVSRPDHIRVKCPYCECEFTDDIDAYIWEELWYNGETSECPSCGKEFRLVGAEYD